MNIEEFAKLERGDKICNEPTQSRGEIIDVSSSGVRVAWGGNMAQTFFYSVNTTAWFHWSLVQKAERDDSPQQRNDGQPDRVG